MTHQGLPVAGYKAQTDERVALVNRNKEIEERVLRIIDDLWGTDADRRWLSIGRTHIEQGFMAVNRAVFKPERIGLPEGAVSEGEDLDHEGFKRRKFFVDATTEELTRELKRRQGAVEYSEGICGDGAAVLRDGETMTISEIVEALNGRGD